MKLFLSLVFSLMLSGIANAEMKYKVLSVEAQGENVVTTVEYDFDGTKVTASVQHFHPQTADDITLGIENRAMSEKAKLDAIQKVQEIAPLITTGQEVVIQ